MQQQLEGEVRLYHNGKPDFETKFFKATSSTDLKTKAAAIAKKERAVHFNCSLATAPEEYHIPGPRLKVRGLGSDVKEQVAAIEGHLGVDRRKDKD